MEKEKRSAEKHNKWKKAVLLIVGITVGLLVLALLVTRLATGINVLAMVGIGGIKNVAEEEYLDENGNYRHATINDPMRFFYQHPIFDGNHYLYSNMEDKYLNFVEAVKLSTFCESQKRDAQVCLDAFNYLIDAANAGEAETLPCFYPDEEIEKEPEKAMVQGVLYHGDKTKPLAIVAAGGGFISVVSDYEGYPYAMELHKAGYNVLVLNYRIGEQLNIRENNSDSMSEKNLEAVKDLTQAVRWLRNHQEELQISLDNYALFGSSAGGMLIDTYTFAEFPGNYRENDLPKPSVIVPIYGLPESINITEKDKGIAIFEVVGKGDEYGFDKIENKIDDIERILGEENVEIRVLDDFPHGAGLGIGTEGEGWILDAIEFWEEHIIDF